MIRHSSKKIISRDALVKIVQDLKQRGATIVTTNGSFDLLHIGHVTMLQEAKSLGDVLIVGMNSDVSVKRYKGKYRPICPQEHRAEMLAALVCTDYITIFDELTPINLLKIIQPDIHVNSPEHGYECVEREVVERHGGRIHLARLVEGMSTSQLIDRILEALSHEFYRGIFLNPKDLVELDNLSMQREPFQEIHKEILSALKQFQTMGYQLFALEHPDNPTMRQIQEMFQRQGVELKNVPRTFESACPPLRGIRGVSTTEQIEKAADLYDISLAKSFIISSEMKDIQIGRAVNCKTILLRKRACNKKNVAGRNLSSSLGPNYTVENFQNALSLLMKIGLHEP